MRHNIGILKLSCARAAVSSFFGGQISDRMGRTRVLSTSKDSKIPSWWLALTLQIILGHKLFVFVPFFTLPSRAVARLTHDYRHVAILIPFASAGQTDNMEVQDSYTRRRWKLCVDVRLCK